MAVRNHAQKQSMAAQGWIIPPVEQKTQKCEKTPSLFQKQHESRAQAPRWNERPGFGLVG
jgi:hypothetical protein